MSDGIGPGDQVICVWDWIQAKVELKIAVPEPGQVYTIREVIKPALYRGVDYHSFLLEEIKNHFIEGCIGEPSFNVAGFRPVKKTNIEEFQSMLMGNRKSELLGSVAPRPRIREKV